MRLWLVSLLLLTHAYEQELVKRDKLKPKKVGNALSLKGLSKAQLKGSLKGSLPKYSKTTTFATSTRKSGYTALPDDPEQIADEAISLIRGIASECEDCELPDVEKEVECDEDGNPIEEDCDEDVEEVECDEDGNPIEEDCDEEVEEVDCDEDGNPIEEDCDEEPVEEDCDEEPVEEDCDDEMFMLENAAPVDPSIAYWPEAKNNDLIMGEDFKVQVMNRKHVASDKKDDKKADDKNQKKSNSSTPAASSTPKPAATASSPANSTPTPTKAATTNGNGNNNNQQANKTNAGSQAQTKAAQANNANQAKVTPAPKPQDQKKKKGPRRLTSHIALKGKVGGK